jgi:RNA polymerase sigma factor (TIGR02999 family)
MTQLPSLTQRLNLFTEGDVTAVEELLDEILPTLHEIAARELKREYVLAQLSKTELIHEIWLANLAKGGWQVDNRGHFFALASLAMRRILIDQARKRLTQRRGGGQTPLSLDERIQPTLAATSEAAAARIVEVGILMERLEAKHPDAARVVDMHYFSGFSLDEIAVETGITAKQVRLRWEKGFKWLKRALRAS